VDLVHAQVFRAQQNVKPLAFFNGEVDVDIAFAAFDAGAHPPIVNPFNDRGAENVDFADKAGDEQVFRFFVDFARRTVLLDFTSRITTIRSDMVSASS
jgi:hypothetical protein